MKLKLYQVDAFTEKVFSGNPAAIIPLTEWLPDEILQKIAIENNLSETAYIVPTGGKTNYHLRWFTPGYEVRLCGHATLATAHTLWCHLGFDKEVMSFDTLSGVLKVMRNNTNTYTLDFPVDILEKREDKSDTIAAILGIQPIEVFRGNDDFMAVLPSQADIEALNPDFNLMKQLGSRGLIATAMGDSVDFVSRCFFPGAGIDEDPVTGSAHTTMTPYWAEQLGKMQFTAQQLSVRKGELNCVLRGDRVHISGSAATYLIGDIYL
jgi:PhzF family phenazine biosynthesis protein